MDKKYLDLDGLGKVAEFVNEKEKKHFTGTQAEWDALTAAEQEKYSVKMITDDETGATVDAVTDGDMRAVTSNAVFQQLRKYQCRNNSITTDINVNGLDGGKTILVMLSSNSGIGDSSSSYIGMIRCGYSGNNFSLTEISKSNGANSPTDLSTALSVNSNGYIVVAPFENAPNIDAEFICNE